MEETVTRKKELAWYKKLLLMEVGQVELMDWKRRTAIRTAISDKLKNDYPHVKYSAIKKETADGRVYLEVERKA